MPGTSPCFTGDHCMEATRSCAPPDAGAVPCTDEGSYQCLAETEQCCGGHIVRYFDGPCWVPDGGFPAPDCTTDPTKPGCPCTTDGATDCRTFGPLVRCVGGVWTTYAGHACCP